MTKRLTTDFQVGTIIGRYVVLREMMPDPSYGRKVELKCSFCNEVVCGVAAKLRKGKIPKCKC